MKRIACAVIALVLCVWAQERQIMMPANMTAGTIGAIKGDTITLKSVMGGADVTVKVTDKTEYRNGQDAGKLSDLKVGDMVAVRGTQEKGVWNADRVIGGLGGKMGGGGGMVMMGGPGGQGGGQMPAAAGTITAIDGDTITVRGLQGTDTKVKTSDKTQFRKGQDTVKLADFKVGDTVMARGKKDGDVVEADMLGSVQLNQQMRGMMENMGKTMIAGRVKAIDGLRLTIDRVDQQEQTIEVDENTSFKKDGQSITFPDIKVGDMIMGRGALKNGTFVPTELNVGMAGGGRVVMGGPPM